MSRASTLLVYCDNLAGLQGVSRRPRVKTTRRQPDARKAPDLVQHYFTASDPNQLWVADITCIPTWTGFIYLAVVLDVWSRRIVGWAMAVHLHMELVLDELDMAIGQRRPVQVIHHSDQGSQYTRLLPLASDARGIDEGKKSKDVSAIS